MSKHDLSQYLSTSSGPMNPFMNAARKVQWALHGGTHPVVPPLPGRDLVPGTYVAPNVALAKVTLFAGSLMAGVVCLFNIVGYGFHRVALFEPLAILVCLLYTSPSPRDRTRTRMPSSA